MHELRLTDYTPHAKGTLFHADPSKYRLLLGAWRAGKTLALVWELIHMALRLGQRLERLKIPNQAVFAIIRKTGPALTDTTQRDLLDCLPEQFILKQRRQEGRAEVVIVGGTRLIFRPIDDWAKMGGMSFDAIAIDEAAELIEGDFKMLKGRLSGKYGPRRMILASNPPTRNHWLHDHFIKNAREGMSVHHFAMLDNQANLAPDYVAEMVAMKEYDEARYRRFVLGEWGFTSDNSPVFPEFRESTHLVPLKAHRGPELWLQTGWDFGYRHPAFVVGQTLPTGHVSYLREMLGTNEDIRIFARKANQLLATYFPGFTVKHFCDPAGKQKNDLKTSSVQELVKEGIRPRYRKLRLNRSIRMMQELMRTQHLGVPMMRVDPVGCPLLGEAFLGGYHMDPDTDEPEKDGFYDHLADAARAMACTALTGSASPDHVEPPPSRSPRVDV